MDFVVFSKSAPFSSPDFESPAPVNQSVDHLHQVEISAYCVLFFRTLP